MKVGLSMKKFLIGILTILMIFAFLILGLALNLETTITENIEGIVKEEITSKIVEEVVKNTNIDKDNVKKEITKVIEKNDVIKNVLDECLNKTIDLFNEKEVGDFDFTNKLDEVIDDSEEILESYGITVTDAEKEKILNTFASEDFNKEFQSTMKEVQENIPSNVKNTINIILFLRSTTCKVILILIILGSLICIALLKKSYYKWIGNLSKATIISGVFYGVLMPMFVNFLNQELVSSERFVLSTVFMNRYGHVLLGLGIIFLILNISFSKTKDKKDI